MDGRKVDLYYANGFLGLAYELERRKWAHQIIKYKSSSSLIDEKSIGEIDVAYNPSHRATQDLFKLF